MSNLGHPSSGLYKTLLKANATECHKDGLLSVNKDTIIKRHLSDVSFFFGGLVDKGAALFTEVTKGHLLRLALCDVHNSAGVLIISHIWRPSQFT